MHSCCDRTSINFPCRSNLEFYGSLKRLIEWQGAAGHYHDYGNQMWQKWWQHIEWLGGDTQSKSGVLLVLHQKHQMESPCSGEDQ